LWWEGGFVRGVASLEGDRVVVFYHLCASEIWLDIRVAFGGCGRLREGNTVLFYFIFTETVCTVRSNRISWCGFQNFFSRYIKRIWKFGKNWYVPYLFHLWISCIIFYSKINYLFFYYMTMFQVCRIISLIGGKLYLKVRG
jgi:hypothetical protein